MTIKNMIIAGLVCCGFASVLTGCSDDTESFYTASADDAPRILNDDLKSSYEVSRNENFTMQILVTPAEFTTIKWLDDDRQFHEGAEINKTLEAGDYNVKVLAVTVKGKETYRTFSLTVKPLGTDPVLDDDAEARLQAPGDAVTMKGSNLTDIKKVNINGREIEVTSATSNSIQYLLPADMPDGQYRLSLLNGSESFGGGLVTVYGEAIITKNDFMGQSEGLVTIPGNKLDDVKTVTVNNQECTIESLTSNQIVVKLPAIEEGVYDVKVTTNNGTALKFLQNGAIVDNATIKVSLVPEESLWEGNYAIDWDHIFVDNSLATKLQEIAKPRAILRLYVKRTDTEYAKGCAAVNWADIVKGGTDPNRGDVEISFEDEFIDFQLTTKSMELLEQNNFQVVGHGFTLQKITLIQPAEEELWSGNYAIDWDHIWVDDDETITTQLKQEAGPNSILRLYVKRTDTEYAKGCAAVGWADIVKGGTDPNRGDVEISFDDTEIEFKLTKKSMELLNSGKLQVVGHGFQLLKMTLE